VTAVLLYVTLLLIDLIAANHYIAELIKINNREEYMLLLLKLSSLF